MGARCNHHVVSKLYLRKFSLDGKSVCLINIDRDQFVPTASISGQCASRNFYGPDASLEEAFHPIETRAGAVISEILEHETLPPEGSEDMEALITFIVIQRSRAQAAARSHDAMTDKFAKLQVEGHPDLAEIDLDDYEIRNQYPVALPAQVAVDAVPQAWYLGAHLFLNNTAIDLITSDEPAVCHNQYCEGITYRGVCGWRSSGIQVPFPISPRVLVLLYDKQVYKVGDKKGQRVSYISNYSEIDQLNAFQILNATHNIYFMRKEGSKRLGLQVQQIAKKRPKSRWRFVHAVRMPETSDETNELIHYYEPLLPQALALTGIEIWRRVRSIPLHKRSSLRRGHAFLGQRRKPRPGDQWERYEVLRERTGNANRADLPPLKWSSMKYGFDHEGGQQWRGRDTRPRDRDRGRDSER